MDEDDLYEGGPAGFYDMEFWPDSRYLPGAYQIDVTIAKEGYQRADLTIYMNILNWSSGIIYEAMESEDEVSWNKNVSLVVQYYTIEPVSDTVDSAKGSGYLLTDPSIVVPLMEIGGGLYELRFNTSVLNPGVYGFRIMIFREFEASYIADVDSQTIDIYFKVLKVAANLSWNIGSDYKLSNLFMKTAYNENVTFEVNYTDNNGAYIDEAEVYVYLNSTNYIETLDLGNGLYRVNFNTTDYQVSLSDISIIAVASNYAIKTGLFNLQILDYWNTQSQLIQSPGFYPWNNTAEFIFRYFCNEAPRYNRNLAGATIDLLNITISQGSGYINQLILDLSTKGVEWDFEDLESTMGYGAGYYRVNQLL